MTRGAEPAAREAFLERAREALGAEAILTERGDLEPYEEGWRYGRGETWATARPRTPEEVSSVLSLATELGLRVQPIGANTGLVGASNPDASGEQLVLSLERLNRTIEVDPLDRTVVVDAGVTLSALNEALEPHGLFYPIDLGADPQIGGMIATNCGGARLVKYGDVRDNLLGLEVVLPDGTLVDGLKSLRKDNTGLDLRQLFCGTSGAYGVITRAVLRLAGIPRQRASALVALKSGEAALALLAHLESAAAEVLTAFETISKGALEATLQHGANLRNPFPDGPPAYAIIVEFTSTFPEGVIDLAVVLEETLGEFMERDEDEEVLDVLVSGGRDFWEIRHQISESLRHEGHVLALDLSVPRSRLAEFTRTATERLAESHPFVTVCDFGHWGDGGTHFNLVWDPETAPREVSALTRELQDALYELCVAEFGGSFSAEHGVGPHNRRYHERFIAPELHRLHAALKREVDPEGRLGHRE